MNSIRAILRIILLGLSLLVYFSIWLILRVPISWSEEKTMKWRHFMVKTWSMFAARVMGLTLQVSGQAPPRPFCLVANHLSYLDVLLMQMSTESLLIAKSDIASWPVIGWLATRLGTIFIDRAMARDVVRVNEIIKDSLSRNEGIVFFPEGTTSDGSGVGRFKASLLNYPAEARYPVHYASISYSTPGFDASDKVCWWADMTFGKHFFELLKIPRVQAFLDFGSEPVTDSDRKRLTSMLQAKISEQFIPVGKHEIA